MLNSKILKKNVALTITDVLLTLVVPISRIFFLCSIPFVVVSAVGDGDDDGDVLSLSLSFFSSGVHNSLGSSRKDAYNADTLQGVYSGLVAGAAKLDSECHMAPHNVDSLDTTLHPA